MGKPLSFANFKTIIADFEKKDAQNVTNNKVVFCICYK